eukprot:1050177-Pelagomonas_calceolata.AAC.1
MAGLSARYLKAALRWSCQAAAEKKEKKRLRKPGPAACIKEGPLTSKLARASPRRFTGPA